ncbi:MAG: hypothetical protein NWE78_05720 [Candidatus Bathyarchaeota archaeon]|nr:hypothetical protein [Candidatus Bathyarchaeota archaeon]
MEAKTFWTRRNKLYIGIVGIVLVCVIVIVAGSIALQFQYGDERVVVEAVIRDYVDTLNHYDVDGSWELMSPTFREDVGYVGCEAFICDYWEAGEHQVEIQEFTDKTFLTWEILRTWECTLNWQLTNKTGTFTEEMIFQVERVDGDWMILNWGYPE